MGLGRLQEEFHYGLKPLFKGSKVKGSNHCKAFFHVKCYQLNFCYVRRYSWKYYIKYTTMLKYFLKLWSVFVSTMQRPYELPSVSLPVCLEKIIPCAEILWFGVKIRLEIDPNTDFVKNLVLRFLGENVPQMGLKWGVSDLKNQYMEFFWVFLLEDTVV